MIPSICGILIVGAGLQVSQGIGLERPPLDKYGRAPTLNRMGMVDTQTNSIIDEFVRFSRTAAAKVNKPDFRAQKYALEIGGAYGYVAKRVLKSRRKPRYILNDLSEDHIDVADRYLMPIAEPGQYETLPGAFPQEVDRKYLRSRPIVSVGAFSVLHFLSGKEIRVFLDAVWDILEPDGRAYFTAGTPYNRLFRGFGKVYRKRKDLFFKNPHLEVFPGEIEDAWALGYLPPGNYPQFFHALDDSILTYLAQSNSQRPFEVLRVENIQRPNPPQQSFRPWYRYGKTEIVGIVLKKVSP